MCDGIVVSVTIARTKKHKHTHTRTYTGITGLSGTKPNRKVYNFGAVILFGCVCIVYTVYNISDLNGVEAHTYHAQL